MMVSLSNIINDLRRRRGIRELQPDEDGLDDLGHEFDSIMLHQLVPELVPVVANYERVVFWMPMWAVCPRTYGWFVSGRRVVFMR